MIDTPSTPAAARRPDDVPAVGQVESQAVAGGVEGKFEREEAAVLIGAYEAIVRFHQSKFSIVTDAGGDHLHRLRVQKLRGLDEYPTDLRDGDHAVLSSCLSACGALA